MSAPLPKALLNALGHLEAADAPHALVTLVDGVGSIPAAVGAKMVVDASGLRAGTIGGGTLEVRAVEHALRLLETPDASRCALVRWNLQRDLGMTCGGVATLLFEAQVTARWRVVVFGAGHVAQALVRCLLLLDCRVICVDPRPDWLARLPVAERLQVVHLPEPVLYAPDLRDGDSIACVTMGHRFDAPILHAILQSPLRPSYLGVIGSDTKRRRLLRELQAAGIAPDRLGILRCPIGLPLCGKAPAEIAISIVAELLQARHRVPASADTEPVWDERQPIAKEPALQGAGEPAARDGEHAPA